MCIIYRIPDANLIKTELKNKRHKMIITAAKIPKQNTSHIFRRYRIILPTIHALAIIRIAGKYLIE
jgi:hypothetical protein